MIIGQWQKCSALLTSMLTAMKGFEEKSSADGVASPMTTLNLQRTKPSGKHQDGVKAIGLKAQEVN